jgi:hypothetical protein
MGIEQAEKFFISWQSMRVVTSTLIGKAGLHALTRTRDENLLPLQAFVVGIG